MTIRRRLTLYYSATILVVATIAVVLMAVALWTAVIDAVRQSTRATTLEVVRALEAGVAPDARLLRIVDDGNVLVVIRDGDGVILVETDHPVAGIGADERAGAQDLWRDALAAGGPVASSPIEAYVYALPITPAASTARVVEAWSSYDARGASTLPIGWNIVYVFGALVLVGLVGGFVHVRGALKPVEALARSAETISASDLSRRLPNRGTRDELDRVAGSFNGVLSRLEASFEEREAALARQRRFTSDASHELRTPLASILGYARMLSSWGLGDPKTAEEGVATIEREARRLVAMTEQLLDLARGDESAPSTRPVGHDLSIVVAHEVETARAASDDSALISLETPDDAVMVMIEPAEVRRALGAVLENAVRFTPIGGTVQVTVGEAGGWATVAVRDAGPGIPIEHQAHVFDRFYRVDLARSTGGSGLGLAIARQIVERHGGRIDLCSVAGDGSTFRLHFPTPSPATPAVGPAG